jgi:hypothetical protein
MSDINVYPTRVGIYLFVQGLWRTELFQQKSKMMKQTVFYGKYNRDYAACLKNAVHFLAA